MEWGSWAEWTAAFGGLAAVVAATVAGYYARKAFNLERDREEEAEQSRRREQASKISAWPSTRVRDKVFGIVLTNASDALVYDVALSVQSEDFGNSNQRLRFLPPGSYFVRTRKWNNFPDRIGELASFRPVMSTDKIGLELSFADAKGVAWRRMNNGELIG
ncbi:MAG: hypothetical protein ACK5KU_11325 [Beutenbergiaceae bacterium]